MKNKIELGKRSGKMLSYEEAKMYVFFQNTGTSSGWRLPTRNEHDKYIDDGTHVFCYYWLVDNDNVPLPDSGATFWALPVRDVKI